MYKIYYNEKLICLLHHAWDVFVPHKKELSLKLPYTGKSSILLSVLDKLEKNKELQEVYIFSNDVKQLKKDFFKLFKIVEAAGGLITNRDGEVLMLFRRGHWDLPKGKIDPGETKKQAAVREVIEETGIDHVTVVGKLTTTYHIYGKMASKRILKPTYWYSMYSNSKELHPEENEGIERAVWVKGLDKNLYGFSPIFRNIVSVLQTHFQATHFPQ